MGEFGKDNGDDNRNGDVGVPRLEGRDNLDSEESRILGLESELSEIDAAEQRTLGNFMFKEFIFVSSQVACSFSVACDILI